MKTVKIDGVELTEEQIMKAVKELEKKEYPPEGTLCYVWNPEKKPEKPSTRYSDGYGGFYDRKNNGIINLPAHWKYWELVIRICIEKDSNN